MNYGNAFQNMIIMQFLFIKETMRNTVQDYLFAKLNLKHNKY